MHVHAISHQKCLNQILVSFQHGVKCRNDEILDLGQLYTFEEILISFLLSF